MPFWIALIYQGARAGGLYEDENISLESLTPFFPKNFPDTTSGISDAKTVANEKLERHYK